MPASITFLGAAQTVTGSKHLLEVDGHRVLVDAGLFQGLKELRERNWAQLPVDPSSIDAVVLTHAHLDHCGYLPRLVASGFKGRVFCTSGTAALARLVLADAGKIQEEDAERANRKGYSKHTPALPLYTVEDAWKAIDRLQVVGYGYDFEPIPGVTVRFINAGHLLGSGYARATVRQLGNRTILFGGDLGRYDRPVLPDPEPVEQADWVLMESTYGNRVHEPDDDGARLASIISDTIERKGKVIIPAFAIGRVEEVLYWIRELETAKRIPQVPVFVDSPMAIEALKMYSERLHELDAEITASAQAAANNKVRGERELCAFCTSRFETVASAEHSKQVTASRQPSIVISASGMATGERVLHHLKAALPNGNNTVLFVGYQAAGTRGAHLVNGSPDTKIHGEIIPVNARIEKIDSMSAHADANELMTWLGHFDTPPAKLFLVHGEPEPMSALASRIRTELRWDVAAPAWKEQVTLA
ncbi:MAG TPA: MBL fold metallo-hydrolase [Gammaproteobacteria bacterium]|nr:MBL fold metallo-hydrolase [Gammaproteobacteria bacterium]